MTSGEEILGKSLEGRKMNKEKNNLMTPSELTYILVGIIIGIGIFILPNAAVEKSQQDAWISAIIGAIYPLYLVLIASYICKKKPKDSILLLSRQNFGKFVGNIFNIMFMIHFAFFVTSITSSLVNVLQVYAVSFIKPEKLVFFIILISAYTASKGLKVLGKINVYTFYLGILLVLSSINALRDGSILNIQPVFGSGVQNIFKGAKETIYSYGGMEFLFIIYPYAKDKKMVIPSAIKSVLWVMLIYAWVVFITIYYMGVDIIPKTFWSFVTVSESIQIPIINNFRFIFMALWTVVAFKTIANDYFAVSYILNDITGLDRKKLCIYIYPIMVYLALRFPNEVVRRKVANTVIPWIIIFDITYITIIALLMMVKNAKGHK